MKELGAFVDRYAAQKQGQADLGKTSRIGMIGAAGDRRDDDMRELGAVAAQHFDVIVIREDERLRGRKPGETAELVAEGARAAMQEGARCRQVEVVLDELEATRHVLARTNPGDLVVMCVDQHAHGRRRARGAHQARPGRRPHRHASGGHERPRPRPEHAHRDGRGARATRPRARPSAPSPPSRTRPSTTPPSEAVARRPGARSTVHVSRALAGIATGTCGDARGSACPRGGQLVGVGPQGAAVGLRVDVGRRLERRPDEVGDGLALLAEVGLHERAEHEGRGVVRPRLEHVGDDGPAPRRRAPRRAGSRRAGAGRGAGAARAGRRPAPPRRGRWRPARRPSRPWRRPARRRAAASPGWPSTSCCAAASRGLRRRPSPRAPRSRTRARAHRARRRPCGGSTRASSTLPPCSRIQPSTSARSAWHMSAMTSPSRACGTRASRASSSVS